MREVNLAGLDLNLLPPLEALLKRRNVSQAAADVGLSQPAMSRALARLREVLGDTLLVRVPGGGYALTPRAELLATRLQATFDHLKAVFQEPGFDPATIERTFRIAAGDPNTILLAPALMARLQREAPGVNIRMEGYGPDIITRMETGALDLTFAVSTTPLPPGARSEPYANDELALVMRKGHPMAKKTWTMEDYGHVNHVGISIMGDAQSDLDAQLAVGGVKRRIALTTPHFIAALATVGETDMVTTVGRVFATRFAERFGLLLKAPPLPETKLSGTLVWSHVRANDRVLAWLRGVIRDVAKDTMDLSSLKPATLKSGGLKAR